MTWSAVGPVFPEKGVFMSSLMRVANVVLMLSFGLFIAGCPPEPQEAIAFSNTSLDFERSQLPRFLEVWNDNPNVDSLTLSVTPSASWIIVNTGSVTSTGPNNRQTVQVSINRSRLTAGQHTGSIVFAAPGIVTEEVAVTVTQDTDGNTDTLNVVNPFVLFSSPYLIDFAFSLHDADGNAVVRDPGQFFVSAREGSRAVGSETGVHIQRGTARQLKVALVLDYTLSMQSTNGAIAAMEAAAKDTLLSSLNEDALVSVTEFHREDFQATQVVPFTVDRAYTRERIDAIQSEVVQGFSAASRMFDAVLDAAGSFAAGSVVEEDRYIIIFTDGNDTSSVATTNDVVNLATNRGVRIYAINFGTGGLATDLQELTSRTEGMLFSAESVSELDSSFQRIVQDLDGQYTIRWASLARDANPFMPGFTLSLRGDSVSYTATDNFVPTRYAGNGVLEGRLRFVTSDSETATTVFLRADYVPRFIRQFSIYLNSDTGFTVSAVDGDNDGLFAGWTMTETPDTENGGVTLFFESPGNPIPFGTFGPLLRVTYDSLLGETDPLFSTVYIDNSIYSTTGGQSFRVDGYDNTPPGS